MRLEFRWRAGTPAQGVRTDRAVLGVFSHIGPTLTLIEALVTVGAPFVPGCKQHVRVGQVSYPLHAKDYTASELEEEVRRLFTDLLRRGEEACRQPASDPEFTVCPCHAETAWLKEGLGVDAVVEQTGPAQYRAYLKNKMLGRVEMRPSARDACTRLLSVLNLYFSSNPGLDLGPELGSTLQLTATKVFRLYEQSRNLE